MLTSMRWMAVILLCTVAAAAGCQPKSGTRTRAGTVQGYNWPFWPSSMRVHPSTRVSRDEKNNVFVIETRIEFFDPDGSTSKAVGQLTLELHDAGSRADEPIQVWNQNLRDLELNNRQYEVVTRTYLFRLEIETSVFPDQPELRAYFLSADGQEITAQMDLRM